MPSLRPCLCWCAVNPFLCIELGRLLDPLTPVADVYCHASAHRMMATITLRRKHAAQSGEAHIGAWPKRPSTRHIALCTSCRCLSRSFQDTTLAGHHLGWHVANIANLQKMAVAERREAEPTTGRRNEVGLAVPQVSIELLAESCRQ